MMTTAAELEVMVESSFTQMIHHVRTSAQSLTHEIATKLHAMLERAESISNVFVPTGGKYVTRVPFIFA